jgi:tetratricopeptide (TPR) repeat protein
VPQHPYQTRLVVNRQGDHLEASWIDGSGQQSRTFPLTLPLSPEDMQELRWYLEVYPQFPGTGDRARARGIAKKIEEWGRALFNALFDSREGDTVYRNLLEAARRRQPCLLTLGSTDPDVLGQPWELMRDDRAPLAFQGITVRRQLVGARPVSDRDLSPPLRVLLIVSRPKDTGFIDPRNNMAPLLDALDVLPEGTVTLDFCDPPTLGRLEEMISDARDREEPYHIVHFDGHGTYLPRTGVGALAFEKAYAATDLVTASKLGDLLARLDVPLVLLEACRGSDLSDRPVFGSLAPALLQSGVGSVIAFSHSVHVEAAKLFVERFYKKLAAGKTVGQALEEARTRLHAERARWLHLGPNAETVDLEDWFIPQLYQVGDDPVLFTGVEGEPRADREGRDEVSLPGFPPPPLYRFHGRAQELLDLERAFRRQPALVLSGGGGMGKTALAREAAHWWRRTGRFDHAVFCSFEQKAGAERVIQLLGQVLEGDTFSSRPAEEQWQTAVRLFRRQRVLLVWDNFETTLPIYQQGEQADSPVVFSEESRVQLRRLYGELTAGEPRGRLLVTCRPDDTLLPGIKKVALGGLARPDSLHLLAAILDREGIATDRPGYERAEVDGLLTMLGDHPLSVSLVAPHFRTLTPTKIREEFGPLLERFKDDTALEARNQSLLASLEFSKRHLSPEAQGVLPYLAWFEGGVFERRLLQFAELTPEAWAPIRSELVATALVAVEEVEHFTTPYLRFHPTLPHAARPGDVPNPEAAEQRFIEVYLAVMQMADQALRRRQPAVGMALLAREEANFYSAIDRAFRRGARQQAVAMADTLHLYFERAGRLRERDKLVAWVRAQVPDVEGLDTTTCNAIRQHAWSRFQQGHAAEAVQAVQDLIRRLESEGLRDEKDPTSQLAVSHGVLGQIYVHVHRPDLALEPLHRAIAGFTRLAGDAARGNLATALGDLANASSDLGQFETALQAAERGLTINREMGRSRSIAVALVQVAAVLKAQERYTEADARYGEALRAARDAGDEQLQGAILQHQGVLQRRQGNPDRAVVLYQQALALFQRAGDRGNEMRTCDLLGSAEQQRKQLEAAEAWYRRAAELAQGKDPERKDEDRAQLAATSHNLGILYQTRAEQATDAESRTALLRQAIDSVQQGLDIHRQMRNQKDAASSYAQLGVLQHMLGELDQAEANLLQGLQISEALNLPDVYKDYGNLADVARDRGDQEAAARWQAKRDAKVAELERLRRGEGAAEATAGVPDGLMRALLSLAQACYQARAAQTPLPADAAEALAQLQEAPAPLPAVASFLHAVAANQPLPPVPADLPPPLGDLVNALAEAVGT